MFFEKHPDRKHVNVCRILFHTGAHKKIPDTCILMCPEAFLRQLPAITSCCDLSPAGRWQRSHDKHISVARIASKHEPFVLVLNVCFYFFMHQKLVGELIPLSMSKTEKDQCAHYIWMDYPCWWRPWVYFSKCLLKQLSYLLSDLKLF